MTYKQLTEAERYPIFSFKKVGFSQRFIAQSLSRSPSTSSGELKKNQKVKKYCPKQAHLQGVFRRHFTKKATKMTKEIKKWIKRLICQDLSPEQVVDYLRKYEGTSLHHETIYRLIYKDQMDRGDLWQYLRVASKRYGCYERRGKIKNKVSINERLEIVDKKARIGDWEGDTIIGKDKKMYYQRWLNVRHSI